MIKDNWVLGRWSLQASSLAIFAQQVLVFCVGAWLGTGAAGALGACLIFERAANPLVQSVISLYNPLVSRHIGSRGLEGIGSLLAPLAACSVGTGLALVLALVGFRHEILHLLYAGRYDAYSTLALLLSLDLLFATVCIVLGVFLGGAHRPIWISRAATARFLITLVTAYPFLTRWSLHGVAAVRLTASTAAVIILLLGSLRVRRELLESPVPPTPDPDLPPLSPVG